MKPSISGRPLITRLRRVRRRRITPLRARSRGVRRRFLCERARSRGPLRSGDLHRMPIEEVGEPPRHRLRTLNLQQMSGALNRALFHLREPGTEQRGDLHPQRLRVGAEQPVPPFASPCTCSSTRHCWLPSAGGSRGRSDCSTGSGRRRCTPGSPWCAPTNDCCRAISTTPANGPAGRSRWARGATRLRPPSAGWPRLAA